MTITQPPAVGTIDTSLITSAFRTTQDVAVFTYREAETYTAMLERLMRWTIIDLIPYLNTNFEDIQDSWVQNVTDFVNVINTGLQTHSDQVDQALSDQQAANTAQIAQAMTDLANSSISVTDPAIAAVLNASSSATLTFLDNRYAGNAVNDSRVHDILAATASTSRDYLSTLYAAKKPDRPTVVPEDYVQAGDNGDWTLAITRALAYATPLGYPVHLLRQYPIKTTLTLNTGDSLVGYGTATGLIAPANAPIIMVQATSKTRIRLNNFTVDANAVSLGTAQSVRTVQFVGCTDVVVKLLTVRHSPDWGLTFKQCTNVAVFDHVHDNSGENMSGSRDGVHFLDTSDALLDGAWISSGDDCVAITADTQAINRVTIRNVMGYSTIAAIVTIGMEGASSQFVGDISIENISALQPSGVTTQSPYVIKARAQNASRISGLRIANVTGQATSHAIWLEGNTTNRIDNLVMSNVNVNSTTNHGILLDHVQHFEVRAVRGKSSAGSYDGVNLTSCMFGSLSGSARSCALWGLQLNACTSVDVLSFIARDNGGPNFAAATGGNGRIVNCTDIQVIGGQFVGGNTTSYNGLSQSGNTTTVISTMTRIGGAH